LTTKTAIKDRVDHLIEGFAEEQRNIATNNIRKEIQHYWMKKNNWQKKVLANMDASSLPLVIMQALKN
jgi:hypothetical protein